MSKHKPVPNEIRERAIAAVEAAWEAGCPVAGARPIDQEAIAETCIRRYLSFARRNVEITDRFSQISDLARGLIEASGQDQRMVGPLIVDYEWLAGKVFEAIIGER